LPQPTKKLKTLQDKFDQLVDNNRTKELFFILDTFEKIGAKAYLVGGCVRDIILGILPKDFDIEVYGSTEDEFTNTMLTLGAIGVGKSFFVYKYKDIDISLPRGEKKIADGHTGFEVYLEQDMKKACQRRDFTMNAMLLDLRSFELIDFFDGVRDIHSKTIRLIDEIAFQEDSLRVLRAMRFAACLGFRVDETTINVCQNITLADLSRERIYKEFAQLFISKYLHYGLFFAIKLGVMRQVFGLQFDRRIYFEVVALIGSVQKTCGNCSEGLLLFAIAQVFGVSFVKLCLKIATPNHFIREATLQKRIPKTITERYVIGIATKMPVEKWLGVHNKKIKSKALIFGVWNNTFVPSFTSADAMTMGLKGDEIGKCLRRERAKEIRENFTKEVM
jgi:tRNA nucleotidyltransferase (CCA-adding enzyme)